MNSEQTMIYIDNQNWIIKEEDIVKKIEELKAINTIKRTLDEKIKLPPIIYCKELNKLWYHPAALNNVYNSLLNESYNDLYNVCQYIKPKTVENIYSNEESIEWYKNNKPFFL
jgi:hypothetical protein